MSCGEQIITIAGWQARRRAQMHENHIGTKQQQMVVTQMHIRSQIKLQAFISDGIN